MKVIVFGASGKTGSLVVDEALTAGHAVTVFTHEKGMETQNVDIIIGDARDPVAVQNALTGQDAVIDTIGGTTPYKETDLETSAARNIMAGMKAHGVERLVVVSAMGVGNSMEQAPFWYEYLLIPTFLRASTKDKTHMEDEVRSSGLKFVIARPGMLTDDLEVGVLKVIGADTKGHKTARGDLARFLVEQLQTDENLGKAVTVVNT